MIVSTVFELQVPQNPAVFCYGFLRTLRGVGDYPLPTLPDGLNSMRTTRTALTDFAGVELIAWDHMVEDAEQEAVLQAFAQGRPWLPPECPVEPGRELTGALCEPSILYEESSWTRISGTGMLWSQRLIPDGIIDTIASALSDAVGSGSSPTALLALIDAIASHSGLKEVLQDWRPIGTFDRFWRAEPDGALPGPLLNVVPEKPDFRTRKPMLKCHVRRHASTLDRAFTLHVTVQNFDEVLKDCVLSMAEDQQEVSIEATTHITDIKLEAFNPNGSMAQRTIAKFTQGFNFGIVARGRADLLPAVFAGAPKSPDLEERARLSTVAVKGPAAGPRSGAFDTLRHNEERIDAIVGPRRWTGECVWLQRGNDSQIGAIRWIKDKLEKPGLSHAYLVDPFLGSDALQRVIARQGNENINLTILVSPGRVNPDADAPDTEAVDDHLSKLVAVANAWSDRLCGNIRIVHLKRGEVARQAFHDRYLCLVDQSGIPTVYMLSNSLSKAGGDWPFAISEFNRIESWQAYNYIQGLLRGTDGIRELDSTEIWRSKQPPDATLHDPPQAAPAASDGTSLPDWVAWAVAFLEKLRKAALRNNNNRAEMGAAVDASLADWRSDVDPPVLAENIFRQIGYRDHYIARVAMRFSMGSAQQVLVANHLEDELLDRFFKGLGGDLTNGLSWQHLEGRDDLVAALARAICRRNAPTNFVRDRLNPTMHSLVQEIEFQRGPYNSTFNAIQIATCLASLVLELAINVEAALKFRQGMACDYIHWIGRLMRSEAVHSRLIAADGFPDFWSDDVKILTRQIERAKTILGEPLQKAIQRVLDDPFVVATFKFQLESGSGGGADQV